MLDLIFTGEINVGLEATDAVPLWGHFALKAQLSILPPSHLGNKLIYAHPRRLMELISIHESLQDPIPSSGSLDELVVYWNTHLSEAISKIAPQYSHYFYAIPAL